MKLTKAQRIASISSFLNKFGTNVIICHTSSDSKKTAMINSTIHGAVTQNLVNNRDVYFYVNGGGTRKDQINQLRACFIDLDAGRDAHGRYLTDKEVQRKKALMMLQVIKCPAQPSIIVETRNGYHLYWLLDKCKDVNGWSLVQNKIANFFKDVGADGLAVKPNQLMRIPFTLWTKPHEGIKKPFEVLLASNDHSRRYRLSNLSSAFKGQSTASVKTKNPSDDWTKYHQPKQAPVEVAFNRNDLYKEIPQMANAVFRNDDDWDVPDRELEVETVSVKRPVVNKQDLLDTAALLQEVANIMKYTGHKFLQNQCIIHAEKLNEVYINL